VRGLLIRLIVQGEIAAASPTPNFFMVELKQKQKRFGHAFMFDTGSSTGEIIGHSKVINAVSIRHQRPFRAATAGDDNLIIFHQGAPYRYDKTIKTHTKFALDVRYAPSGDHFASVGSDGKVFLYDGKVGDSLGEFSESHTGTAYALSWSPDSNAISTCSADTTVKLWDIETRKATTTYTLGTGLPYQQVGNVWNSPDTIVSLSFSGDLNVFDRRVGEKPVKVLHGPQKTVTDAISNPTAPGTFFVGSADGRVLSYDSTGEAAPLTGQGHTNLVSGLIGTPDGRVFTAGYDDRVREVEGSNFTESVFITGSQPKALAATSDNTVFVVGVDTVEAVRNNQKVAELRSGGASASSSGASATAITATGSLIAIGFGDQKVRLYNWDGKSFQEVGILEANKGLVSALAFSPDGLKLAAGDWKSHPLRRYEARSDHLPLVLPFSARKLVELDRGLATLCLRCARYARIRLERPEAPKEHSDQERSGWGRQCRPLVVRWRRGQRQRQVGGDGRGRSDQGVAGQVPRVTEGGQSGDRNLYSTLLYIGVDQPAAARCGGGKRCPWTRCLDERFTVQRAADRSIQSALKRTVYHITRITPNLHFSFHFFPDSFLKLQLRSTETEPRTLNTAMRKLSVTLRRVY